MHTPIYLFNDGHGRTYYDGDQSIALSMSATSDSTSTTYYNALDEPGP